MNTLQRMNWLTAGSLVLCLLAAKPAHAMDPPDAWVTTKVKMSLLTGDGVSTAADVNVDTVEGRVTLHGVVPTETEKARAEQISRSIDGVRTVQNLLQVVPTGAKEAVSVADAQLEKNVAAVLARDAALESSSVKIASVHDGVVLLSGSARTLSAHRRALEDARAVPGVKRVSSEIESPDKLGDDEIFMSSKAGKTDGLKSAAYDTWITTAAKARLLATADVPALDVSVDTRNGVVTLFGKVPSVASRSLAEAAVKKVDGVRAVRNDLEVVPGSAAKRVEETDDRLSAAIDQRLEAKGELEDGSISVHVKNGVARLTGSVASQNDRMLAMTTTRRVPGVRSVIDDLTVKN